MIKENQGRYIRRTTSGQAIDRDTRLAGISAKPGAFDLIVYLRNGGSGSEIAWVIEADNGAGSHAERFDPPLRFKHGIYVEMASANLAECHVNLNVIEPVE